MQKGKGFKMKNGFTMIELIFVIVILGILSAIAIPKMMATKDDANIVKEIQNARQIVKNAGVEYLTQGSFSSYPSSDCFEFTTTTDGDLIVSLINTSDNLCQMVSSSKLLSDINRTYHFGGSSIIY